MKRVEELKEELEVVEKFEPCSIKEMFEKMKRLAEIRKKIREMAG